MLDKLQANAPRPPRDVGGSGDFQAQSTDFTGGDDATASEVETTGTTILQAATRANHNTTTSSTSQSLILTTTPQCGSHQRLLPWLVVFLLQNLAPSEVIVFAAIFFFVAVRFQSKQHCPLSGHSATIALAPPFAILLFTSANSKTLIINKANNSDLSMQSSSRDLFGSTKEAQQVNYLQSFSNDDA